MADFDFDRFVQAQAGVMPAVRRELATGCKRTHWMWFVFPQLAGLGRSSMAQHYAIRSLVQADAYLQHPVLGARLIECTNIVLEVQGRTIADIFGAPDDMKFHSCMTLFSRAPDAAQSFERALTKFLGGEPDEATLRLLQDQNG